jgi:type IV secretory pathway VirB6-like protein
MPLQSLTSFVLRLCVVIPLIAVGSTYYQKYVIDPVLGFPSWWQTYLLNSSGPQPVVGASPASIFDDVYVGTWATSRRIWASVPWSFHSFEIALELAVAQAVIVLSLAAMFAAFAILTILTLIALILGPIVIPFLLFQRTQLVFWSWLWVTVTLLLSMFAIDIIVVLFATVSSQLIAALALTGTPDTDLPGFWGAALVFFLMGCTTVFVPRMVERVGGGVSVGLDSVRHHMTLGPVRNAATNVIRRI